MLANIARDADLAINGLLIAGLLRFLLLQNLPVV
jgi:hypothetical protein